MAKRVEPIVYVVHKDEMVGEPDVKGGYHYVYYGIRRQSIKRFRKWENAVKFGRRTAERYAKKYGKCELIIRSTRQTKRETVTSA